MKNRISKSFFCESFEDVKTFSVFTEKVSKLKKAQKSFVYRGFSNFMRSKGFEKKHVLNVLNGTYQYTSRSGIMQLDALVAEFCGKFFYP